MKKIFSIFLLSGLLVGCGNTNENNVGSQEEVVAAKQEEIQELDFTSGVDESGISQADKQNYIDIKGRSNKNKNVYVIYNGTIVDEIMTDSNGEFKYYSRSNDEITKIGFSNDENLRAGDLNVNTSNLKNYKEITILPSEEFVASKKEEIISKEKSVAAEEAIRESNSFEIGEPIQFTSSTDNSIEVTVNSLDTFYGDEWDQPEGVYFLKVDYTIENLSDYEYPANAHMFSVYDGNNEKAERISKDYFSEKIASGKKASGVSYFDVKNEGPFEVHSLGAYWVGDTQ